MGAARRYLEANEIRVPDEQKTLYISLGVLALILLSSFWALYIPLIAVGIAAVWVVIQQNQLVGQCVKVSESQFPDVYNAAKTAAERLSMIQPDVFIKQNSDINAYAIGFLGKKSVVLHSATVEAMDDKELTYILGHEFSHIKCAHTNWTVISSSTSAGLGIPVISQLLGFVFLFWSRKAEYTGDRGGLLASRDLKAGISAMAKLAVGGQLFAQMNIDSLMDQKMDLDQSDLSGLSEAISTHPYTVTRIHELRRFSDSDAYRRLTGAEA